MKIIDEKGLDYFARAEEEAVLSLDIAGTVIATGGSVVYSPAAMEHLRRCACDALQTDDIIVEDIPDEERAKQADRDYEEQKDAFFRRNMAGAMGRCAAPAGTDYFPNAINTKGFEKPIFDSNKNFISTTMYQFY